MNSPNNSNELSPLPYTCEKSGPVKFSLNEAAILSAALLDYTKQPLPPDALRTYTIIDIQIDESFIDTDQRKYYGSGYSDASITFSVVAGSIIDVAIMLYRDNRHSATELLMSMSDRENAAYIIPHISSAFSKQGYKPDSLPRDFDMTCEYIYDLARTEITARPSNLFAAMSSFLQNAAYRVVDQVEIRDGLATSLYLDEDPDLDMNKILHNFKGYAVIEREFRKGKMLNTRVDIDMATAQSIADPIGTLHSVAQAYELDAKIAPGNKVDIESAEYFVEIMPTGDASSINGRRWASQKAEQLYNENTNTPKGNLMGSFTTTSLEYFAKTTD